MIINTKGRRDSTRGEKKKERNQKTLISSRFHYYEPQTSSLSVPVIVFDDVSSIDFDKAKACIISIETKVFFIMCSDHTYYIMPINDAFIKIIQNYKQVILADKTIYMGKEESNSGVQLPLYIN